MRLAWKRGQESGFGGSLLSMGLPAVQSGWGPQPSAPAGGAAAAGSTSVGSAGAATTSGDAEGAAPASPPAASPRQQQQQPSPLARTVPTCTFHSRVRTHTDG